LRATDAVTLTAVVTVVLLVSLPRLRHFALRENESDARQVVRTLAELVSSSVQASECPPVGELVRRDASLERQWLDVEYLAEGTLLRRHGYLFEVAYTESGVGVRAWPWQHGRTGTHTYAWLPEAGVLVHPNGSGAWSGDDRPPLVDLATAGWTTLPPD
jgi:hypothetical protein